MKKRNLSNIPLVFPTFNILFLKLNFHFILSNYKMRFLLAITLTLALASSEQSFLDSKTQTGSPLVFVSDSSTWVVGVGTSEGAPATLVSGPYWTANIPGANWICDAVHPENTSIFYWKTFFVRNAPTKATLQIAADDGCRIWIKGVNIGQDTTSGTFYDTTQRAIEVTKFLEVGQNILKVEVMNGVRRAGLLYKLSIS